MLIMQRTKDNGCSLDLSKESFLVRQEYNEFILVPQFAFASREQAIQGIGEIINALKLENIIRSRIDDLKHQIQEHKDLGLVGSINGTIEHELHILEMFVGRQDR